MTNREAIKLLKTILRTVCLGNQKFIDAVKKAISALEKQTVDKCCETCKHKNHTVWKRPCNGCYLTTSLEDYWEPYTEEEA